MNIVWRVIIYKKSVFIITYTCIKSDTVIGMHPKDKLAVWHICQAFSSSC